MPASSHTVPFRTSVSQTLKAAHTFPLCWQIPTVAAQATDCPSIGVVETRLDKMVRREIDVQITKSTIWSDSACVLGYISETNKQFHTFVANRVAAIQEVSITFQWRHVDSHQNPADDASRGLSTEELTVNRRWLKGPDFCSSQNLPGLCLRLQFPRFQMAIWKDQQKCLVRKWKSEKGR